MRTRQHACTRVARALRRAANQGVAVGPAYRLAMCSRRALLLLLVMHTGSQRVVPATIAFFITSLMKK